MTWMVVRQQVSNFSSNGGVAAGRDPLIGYSEKRSRKKCAMPSSWL
jgi:hypothetical protein